MQNQDKNQQNSPSEKLNRINNFIAKNTKPQQPDTTKLNQENDETPTVLNKVVERPEIDNSNFKYVTFPPLKKSLSQPNVLDQVPSTSKKSKRPAPYKIPNKKIETVKDFENFSKSLHLKSAFEHQSFENEEEKPKLVNYEKSDDEKESFIKPANSNLDVSNLPLPMSHFDRNNNRTKVFYNRSFEAKPKLEENFSESKSHGSMFHKTRICQYYQQGFCVHGADCKYAHGEEDKKKSPLKKLPKPTFKQNPFQNNNSQKQFFAPPIIPENLPGLQNLPNPILSQAQLFNQNQMNLQQLLNFPNLQIPNPTLIQQFTNLLSLFQQQVPTNQLVSQLNPAFSNPIPKPPMPFHTPACSPAKKLKIDKTVNCSIDLTKENEEVQDSAEPDMDNAPFFGQPEETITPEIITDSFGKELLKYLNNPEWHAVVVKIKKFLKIDSFEKFFEFNFDQLKYINKNTDNFNLGEILTLKFCQKEMKAQI